jgi:hypothetical protein
MTRATSPFHAGEQTIQSLAGVRDRIELRGRAVIRDYMPEQHRAFFAALPFMVVGLADQNGHPWTTTLSGPPGFMNSTDENLLTSKRGSIRTILCIRVFGMALRSAGWESNFQRAVETESTVASKIASLAKVSR